MSYLDDLFALEGGDDLNEFGEGGVSDEVRYEKYCSMDVVKEVRVLHKPGADDILSPVETKVQNDTNSVVWLHWEPPSDPNELIVSYFLQYKTKLESNGGAQECVTAKAFNENGHRFRPDRTGSYYVRVKAVSVYGDGEWTDYTWITVPGEITGRYLSKYFVLDGGSWMASRRRIRSCRGSPATQGPRSARPWPGASNRR